MNSHKGNYPPLTCADILTLKSKPAITYISKSSSNTRKKLIPVINKEWIYYNQDDEQHFYFKNDLLVHWEKDPNPVYARNLKSKNIRKKL